MNPPIELTLYDQDDQPKETFQRNVIPWGLLKKAIGLQKQFEDKGTAEKKPWWKIWQKDESTTAEEAQMRAISQFVVELFGNKFSVKDLEVGADIGEVMTVFQTVIARASSTVKLNPTRKPSFKK